MNEEFDIAFGEHYTNRYKKLSESVNAYDPDIQDAFSKGEVMPSNDPRETLGMPEDQHNLLTTQRVDMNQLRVDNPAIRINEDGTHTLVDKQDFKKVEAEHVDKEGQPVQKNYNDLTPQEQTDFWKMNMLESIRDNKANRTVIDPDQIFDPDTGMNTALKVVTEVGEGIVEGFENTARSAAILAYETFTPSDPIGRAFSEIINSNAVSTTDLRAGILPDVKNADGMGYGFLRGIAQFAPNFIAFNRALSAFSSLRSANMTRGFLAGMPTDATAFDSVDGNLHDLAIAAGEVDIAGLGMVNLDNEYTRFMSSSAQDTQAEGRFRNVVEGGLVGVAFDAAIRGAAKGYTKGQQSALRKKFTELYVSTAKNLRDFRVESANKLEAQGMDTLKHAYEAKQSGMVEMHSGIPVSEHQSKAIKALSEIALSKLMKGEIVDYKSWAETANTINADLGKKYHHGSPHKFDKFSMDKIGTGEGAQTYGHGLYFAESKEVAGMYQEQLRPATEISTIEMGGVPLFKAGEPVDYGIKGERTLDKEAIAVLQEDLLINEWKLKKAFDESGEEGVADVFEAAIDERIQFAKDEYPEILDSYQKIKDKFKTEKKITELDQGKSHIYEVDVPDEQVANFLDWDAPLSEQPHIMEALKVDGRDWRPNAVKPEMSGQKLYDSLSKGLTNLGALSKEEASEFLNKLGIKGIKYFDGDSRLKGEGTRNLVIFDDSIVTTISVNDELSEQALKESWNNAVEYQESISAKRESKK